MPPAVTGNTGVPSGANPAGTAVVNRQAKDKLQKAQRADLTPRTHPVTLRIDIAKGQQSWLVVRRLTDLKQVVYEHVLSSPDHIGGKMQKDTKGYLITAACNPAALTLHGQRPDVHARPAPTAGRTRSRAKGLVPTRAPAGVPTGGC